MRIHVEFCADYCKITTKFRKPANVWELCLEKSKATVRPAILLVWQGSGGHALAPKQSLRLHLCSVYLRLRLSQSGQLDIKFEK